MADKNQLLYHLQNLKFIKNIGDSGIVIDEYVWQEVNSILAKNPAWKGISIHSPAAGQLVLLGYLKTRKEAEQLNSYMSLNFPYLDLLKKQIVVEEDVTNQIYALLLEKHLEDVVPQMVNGEITLTGTIRIGTKRMMKTLTASNKFPVFGLSMTKSNRKPLKRD